ncbi:MAG: glutamate-5-semialdehyde dehydrogenase [Nitrospirae bacterium]|nr:MAG: glutamate-5-semialdehyde dehydrogenase [Nitrospirota bacterium]
MVEVPVKIYMTNLAKKAREAVRPLSLLANMTKTLALHAMADRLEAEAEAVLAANLEDVEAVGKKLEGETNKDTVKEAVDRVRLTAEEVREMAGRLREVAELPDPVGEITKVWRRPNGMQVSRVRVPIGAIGIVSDLGPKHTTDAVALCLKAGNVSVVRGGSEWTRSNQVIGTLLREAAESSGVPAGAVTFVERSEKEAALELLRQNKYLDAIIPRGGAGLRKTVMEQTRLPILCHDAGMSYVYIDGEADLPLAQNIVVNSKAQEPSASNSVDMVLVHQSIARPLLGALVRRLLDEFKVDVLGCPKTMALAGSYSFSNYKNVKEATEEDWGRQFLSPTLAIRVVKDMDEAVALIGHYGPVHTAAIVTREYASAMRFTREVDASAVLVNASTRFNDGSELGLGGEVGTSTLRVHARGPISLEELTCQKYVVLGTGQLRQPHPVPVAYEDAIMLKRPS